jgi:ABC-2 type transport system permease protein
MSTALDLAAGTRRVRGLALTNTRLLLRNRLATFYAFAVPLLALALLVSQDPDQPGAGVATVATVLSMALLFPVYYNLLSVVVTRRDELVLKRLRTGEVRDGEILLSLALPGVGIALLICLVTMVVTPLLGFSAPANPVVMLLGMVVACVTFVALALWTAAWTRNAEAAQLTSAPVILLTMAGLFRVVLPEASHEWLVVLPGAAVEEVVQAAWFGVADDGSALSLLETFTASGPGLAVLVAWTVLGLSLVARSMPWEPRP